MSLQTPSPHRFLPGARRQPSPSKAVKPPSRLVHSTAVHQERTPAPAPAPAITTPQQLSRPNLPPPSASQFAPTPRFSFAKPKASTQQQNAATSPPRSSMAHVLRPPRPREDVEDAASSDLEADEYMEDDTEMLLTTEQNETVQPSIERDPEHQHQTSTTELPFSPKRRRLDSDVSPQQHVAGATSTHSRFAHVNLTSTSTPAPIARPSFLRPPTPPLPGPLPQTFSPHRRGAAFVPGGAASTVQAWVVAAGQSATQSRRQQQAYQYLQTQGEGWGFRVRVERAEEMEGGGWRVVGLKDDGTGERARCLLVGEGKGEVRLGGYVGVKGLGWDVDVDKEGVWWVGVGWEGG